ncbi:MAG: pathogenicity locus [Bacteroidetes bacterium]|nr:pathogenicity locus [Bacteroidota bacterium]MBS1973783.1 pathogenicity locus [Bacteroidota bacterium]
MKQSFVKSTKNFSEKETSLYELQVIPGVGKSIANDLYNIGIHKVSDLRRKNPEKLYQLSNQFVGNVQDRCLLYVFRCAVYFAETPKPDKEKLNWWWWKDNT